MADFKGVQVLEKFISLVRQDFVKPLEIDNLESSFKRIELAGSTKSLSCRVCHIDDFTNLAEFKAHRQSNNHLSKLNATMELSESHKSESEDEDSFKTGSPFLTVNHKSQSVTLYKTLIATKKEPIYEQLEANLNHELFKRLEALMKLNILIALNGGGYFAAALFSLTESKLVASKTLKRYTSRRKQGGTQSNKDNTASRNIHSAGALIRRENEKKLREEISGLFGNWESTLQPVVIYCNRDPYLLDLLPKYGTLKTLPFTTYQACFEEASRCFSELFRIKSEL